MTTPSIITEIGPGQIFIFGSNIVGDHLGGAAKAAMRWGAQMGRGLGMSGQTWAFPTLDENMQPYDIESMEEFRDCLYKDAIKHQDHTFILTRVGCGIAGIDEDTMKSMFTDHLINIMYPEGW